ncbi:unnamed protein product [Mytilus edulis]|uniref:Exonuclease domain-containing protein n=1 Tax=Mytilus edulis TaxID=6550 RepID=A0A8S3V2P8_MYTED|nr:unnamed protein product [Mytilus edulis]
MQPDMAISMARESEKTGCSIDVIHGDNDSTATSRMKAVFPSIEKKEDSNHTKKGITSKLYKLSHKYKVLKQPNVISYIGRCFMYAIKECQTKEPESLRKSPDIIVPHLYGDHSLCANEDVTWCSYQKNPSHFSRKEETKEIHAGVTYSEAAELYQDEELTQTTEIPNRLTLPENQFTYVVFDTETTDRGRNSDILQIAAGNDFNASAVNMLRYDRGTNTMFHRGIPVLSKPIQEALLDFIEYLKKFPQPVLVGHNACNFDIPIVCNRMAEFKLFSEFFSHVFGFVHTLKISQRIFQKSDVGNYKQENLVSKLLTNCTYQVHDAKEDVRV